MPGRRISLEAMPHAFVDNLVLREQVAETGQMIGSREFAVDQQQGRLDERGMFGQLLDWNPAILEDAVLAIDESDRRQSRTRVAVAVVQGDIAALGPQLADVDRQLAFRSLDDGQFILFPVQNQLGHFCGSCNVAAHGRAP